MESLGTPNSHETEEGEIDDNEIMVNHDDDEEYIFEESQIATYLEEEMAEFDATIEPNLSTGEPIESDKTTTPKERKDESGKPMRHPKKIVHGKPGLSSVQIPGKPGMSTKSTKKAKSSQNEKTLLGTPDFEKVPFDPKKHLTIPPKKQWGKKDFGKPNVSSTDSQHLLGKKDSGKPNLSSADSQHLLRRSNIQTTRQYPRENVTFGIDRGYNVPRVFTKAKRSDFRSYYRKFMKKIYQVELMRRKGIILLGT